MESKNEIYTSSKYTGVTWDKANNKWLSQIKINGISTYLGRFDCEEKASKAYQDKLSILQK